VAVPVLVGAATMSANVLVDSLVADVIDGLREDLHPQFGVRAYRLYRVIRTWAGAEPGEGSFVDVGHELRPQPRVKVWDGLRYVQAVCGVEELGDVFVTEVSLTYTHGQLTGQPLAANAECFLAIGEAHGQGQPIHLFTHTRPPFVDREKDMGWSLALRRVQSGAPWQPT
jgi:hypothetical protein